MSMTSRIAIALTAEVFIGGAPRKESFGICGCRTAPGALSISCFTHRFQEVPAYASNHWLFFRFSTGYLLWKMGTLPSLLGFFWERWLYVGSLAGLVPASR